MRWWTAVAATGLVVAASSAGADAARDSTARPSASKAEQRAIYAVARAGRRAVFDDRPATVCALLTWRAQRNSLTLDGIDRDTRGRPRPKPVTCEQAVGYMIADVRASGDLRHARRFPQSVRLKILRVRGRRAHLALGTGLYRSLELHLLKTSAGWRGDHSNFAPFGSISD